MKKAKPKPRSYYGRYSEDSRVKTIGYLINALQSLYKTLNYNKRKDDDSEEYYNRWTLGRATLTEMWLLRKYERRDRKKYGNVL